jgi:hypothetical protein
MKHHYGEDYVPRCSKWKKYANGTWRPKQERQEVSKLMKRGRRMARRKAKQDLKDFMDR